MSKRIFLIDDADFMLDMLQMVLHGAGHFVVGSALDGVEAVKSLSMMRDSGERVDIVIVDFHMPKLDGVETIRRIKALVPGVKVLLISANSTLPVVMKAKEVGVDGFVVKPFDPKTLLDSISNLP